MDLNVSFIHYEFNSLTYESLGGKGLMKNYSDLSFAAWQYQLHGYISNSMIIVNILHAFYVVDFFINEDWLVPPHLIPLA